MVSIIITAPLGAILINTLGIRWLSCDAEEKETNEQDVKNDIELPALDVAPKDI